MDRVRTSRAVVCAVLAVRVCVRVRVPARKKRPTVRVSESRTARARRSNISCPSELDGKLARSAGTRFRLRRHGRLISTTAPYVARPTENGSAPHTTHARRADNLFVCNRAAQCLVQAGVYNIESFSQCRTFRRRVFEQRPPSPSRSKQFRSRDQSCSEKIASDRERRRLGSIICRRRSSSGHYHDHQHTGHLIEARAKQSTSAQLCSLQVRCNYDHAQRSRKKRVNYV